MKVLQLVGEAKCSGYIQFELHLQSQLGKVIVENLEAYIVKGMQTPLLLGEEFQKGWHLHTMHPNKGCHWCLGETEHWFDAKHTLCNKENFSAWIVQMEPDPPKEWRAKVIGTGKLTATKNTILVPRQVTMVQISGNYDSTNRV